MAMRGFSTEPREKNQDALMVPEEEEVGFREARSDSVSSTPFDQVYRALLDTHGEKLEMMSRTTPALAVALYRNHTRRQKYATSFDQDEKDLLLRISISSNGLGRKEMVEALQSGSGVPGEFFGSGFGGRGLDRDTQTPLPEDEDE